jgi:PAS domain S-box-containing protein
MQSIFSRLSLSAKGILVVLIPLCALAVALVLFSRFEAQTREAQKWVEHTVQVRGEIRQLITLMAKSESAVRGYLLARREDVLAPYVEGRSSFQSGLITLRSLVSDNPLQTQQVQRVEDLAGPAFQALDQLRSQSVNGAALQSESQPVDAVNAQLDGMLAEEERLLGIRTQAARTATSRLHMSLFAGAGFGLLGGIMAALLFTNGIVRRVDELEKGARLLAAGQPVTTEVQGEDEIARLQRTLNHTSALLTNQAAELQAAQAGLERRVAQRTSELRSANELLRQANQIREALLQSSPLAIWTLDLEGRVTFWNPAAERIFGWTEQEVIGRPAPVIPPEDEEEYSTWLEHFRQGKSWSGIERVRVRKDGGKIDVAIWTAPLRDEEGRISGTIAIDSDISDRKLLEEQFRQSQKLEAVGRLAGGVAHDFNNLLTVISGYTEMIAAETRGNRDLAEYAREVQYAASRAAALTAQLLAFSRRQISQPRILDLNELVEHSIKLLQRVIGEDIQIEIHPHPPLDRIKADPTHIDQLIMNLVVNARDAMTKGGRLTIETANTWLDEQYAGRHIGVKPGRYVMLAVSDTGHGMTEEVRSRLFEPFFTTKPVGKGTGLGLSIVYGIVKQNHGEIMVYSEPGKGTSFKIYFPVVQEAAEAPAAEAGAGDVHGAETVLVCEDEEHIRKLITAVLTRLGYTVLESASPDDAMKIAGQTERRIDLLLTDIVMPQGNGLDLARRAREIRPRIRILFMSGYADNHLSGSWVFESDTPFLQKPFTGATLGRKVRETLDRKGGNGSTSPGGLRETSTS